MITRIPLSASGNGAGIKVTQTSGNGDLVHSAQTSGSIDEVFLWAYNDDTTARELTVQYAGTTSPDNVIKVTIPPKAGLIPVLPGLPLSGGASLRALASAANVVVVYGYVNRIS